MSKKMLKRSLALGALMAFVITGSAMAAENLAGITNCTDYGPNGTHTDQCKVKVMDEETVELGSVNYNLTRTGIFAAGITKADGTYQGGQAFNNNPNVNLHAKDLRIVTTSNGVILQYGAKLYVDVDEDFYLKADGNGVHTGAEKAGKIELDANDVTVIAGENAVWTRGEEASIIIDATNDVKVESECSNPDEPGRGYAVLATSKNSSIRVEADNIVDLDGVTGAIKATNNSTINVIGNSIDIDVISNNPDSYVDAVRAGISNVRTNDNGIVNLTATKDINIDISGQYVSGIIARGQYGAGYGEKDTNNVQVSQGGIVTVNAENLNITANGSESGTGIWAANGSTEADGSKVATITINAKNTTIEATSSAISNHSQGIITINNNLTATAPYVLDTRGDAVTNINTDGKGVVNLTGDILFGYATNSGTKIDAKVDLVLSDGSKFEGKIVKDISAMSEENQAKAEMTTVNGMKISLNKGATWNLTGASIVNSATFGEGSVLEINGADFVYDATEGAVNTYALNGVGTADVLKVDGKANIKVEGIDYKKYNVATGFENEEVTTTYWNVSNLNSLMQGNWIGNAKDGLQLEVVAKAAEQMATEMGVSSSTAQSLNEVTSAAQNAGVKGDANGTGSAKAVAFVEAMSGVDSKVAGQAFEAVSKMAEAGGNSATAASIVKNVTGVTNDRLSFNCGHSAPHKGGHGVGLFEEGSGADVWVEYVHGKDEVEDMPSTAGATSYEGQYNGIVMGVDFKKVNKFQSGVAFNYGEGDTNSVGSAARTRSDYDFWGIGYYGSIHNDDSNVIFDIGYARTDSDVENTSGVGVNFKASPETTTWTAGVKLEKLYQNENVQIVPYTGLRFMSIDPEDYSTECASASYQMERQNVWLLPLGVSIRQEIANDNGWTVSPKVDLSYIWAFGDTDSEMEFSTLGTKTNIGYEVMDDGSFLGLVGIEAHKGQWGFGVSYSYQKGDYSTSKKWFIDANYSF